MPLTKTKKNPVVYLDYLATTPLDPKVWEAMQPYFTEHFGNAASTTHAYGWRAKAAVDLAREQIAELIGAAPQEIYFTSGATESNNLAILGYALALEDKRKNHLITVKTEHRAVLDPFRHLESQGFRVSYLNVDGQGRVDLKELESALGPETALISVMMANNEVGTLQPLAEIAELARTRGVVLHSDAAQAAGKVDIDVGRLPVDLLSLSAHKMYGPKGVGALYVRKRKPALAITPLFYGGGHEGGLRSGTLNVPGVVGLSMACQLARQSMAEDNRRLGALRDHLAFELSNRLKDVVRNSPAEHCLSHALNLSFLGIKSSVLLMELKHFALSASSACKSADPQPSHVLQAMGLKPERIESAVRFGLGRFTTQEEIEDLIAQLESTVTRLRA